MAQSMTFSRHATGGNLSIIQTITVTGDNVLTYETSVDANQTDNLLTISLDVDQLKGYYIISLNGEMTLDTNSTSVPDDTIVLVANEPLLWTGSTDLYTNKLGTDVTKIYLTTEASGSTRTLKMIFVQDATP